ncbi:MAG TPA: hypothetical protein VII74_04390 [Chthoniobacterales bacterium]
MSNFSNLNANKNNDDKNYGAQSACSQSSHQNRCSEVVAPG